MLVRVLGRVAWFTTKVAVKYVVVPIALTALWAAVAETMAERTRDAAAQNGESAAVPARPKATRNAAP